MFLTPVRKFALNAEVWGVRRKGRCAVPAEEKVLSPPIRKNRGYRTMAAVRERRIKVSEIQGKLDDQRHNLQVLQRLGHVKMWGLALWEYAQLLGKLEELMTDSGTYL